MSYTYLDRIREENKARMNYCYLCGEVAKGIIAKQHLIKPVCQKHLDKAEITEAEKQSLKDKMVE
jgi:hypothetical protein